MPRNPNVGSGRLRTSKRRNKGVTDPHLIVRAQRARDILEQRLQGWSLDAIGQAQKPKLCAQRVHQIIAEELARLPKEPAEQVRVMEFQRLDAMQAGFSEKATNGDILASGRVLDIMRRRSEMMGFDAPTRVEQSGPGGGPIESRVVVEDASASFNAKALAVLDKMRSARETKA